MKKMKKIKIYLFSILSVIILLCSCSHSAPTVIEKDTFVYKLKVYKIINNEINLIGDLNSNSIKQFKVNKESPKKRDLGESSLAYLKPGAHAQLDCIFRSNKFYFNLSILKFNDLMKFYPNGSFQILFKDEYGFILYSTDIPTSELTKISHLVNNQTILEFTYSGKTEMSNNLYRAIASYSLSSPVK
jgi:hypothetical protein